MRLRDQVLQDALALEAEDRAYVADQTDPALSLQRLLVETYYANFRTYRVSRCVHRGDPELPRGLKGK